MAESGRGKRGGREAFRFNEAKRPRFLNRRGNFNKAFFQIGRKGGWGQAKLFCRLNHRKHEYFRVSYFVPAGIMSHIFTRHQLPGKFQDHAIDEHERPPRAACDTPA